MPSQVAEAEKTGAEPSASLSDEDLEAEQWGINTNTPSPTPLGEAAPLLTQPMEGEVVGEGEDALNALVVAACQASAAALPSKVGCPQKMDPPETANAGVASASMAAAMSNTLLKPEAVWAAATAKTTGEVITSPPPIGKFGFCF